MHKNIENDIMNGLPWGPQTPDDARKVRELLELADAENSQELREEAYAILGLYVDREFLVTGTQPGAVLSEARLLELTGLSVQEARLGEQMQWGPWRVIEGKTVVGSVMLEGEDFECMWQIEDVKIPKGYVTPAEWARKKGVSRQTAINSVHRGRIEGVIVHGGRYLIPENAVSVEAANFPVPELIKPERNKEPKPEREEVPEGMISVTEWSEKRGLTDVQIAHLRVTGQLEAVKFVGQGNRLFVPADLPVPPRKQFRPSLELPEGYMTVSMWAQKVGITKGEAQGMLANGLISGVITHANRSLVPENAELPQ